MSHLPLDARAILEYLNELGYRNISAEQLKEFMKGMQPQLDQQKNKFKTRTNISSNSNSQNSNNNNKKTNTNQQSATVPSAAAAAAAKTTTTTHTPTAAEEAAAATPTPTTSAAAGATPTDQQKEQQQLQQQPSRHRSSVKIIKGKNPLCNFRFYLDIRDHQTTKRVEEEIQSLGGNSEFFLNANVTHFITDKPLTNISSSRPGSPQTAATPTTPQTPFSIESLEGGVGCKGYGSVVGGTPNGPRQQTRTRQSRADAILSRARQQQQQQQQPQTTQSQQSTASPGTATVAGSSPSYVVWQTEHALRFLKKVRHELKHYLEPGRKSRGGIEPTIFKGDFIKIESLKRNFRPYYHLYRAPKEEWPRIELTRDDGAFRLSPKRSQENRVENAEDYVKEAGEVQVLAKDPLPPGNMTRKSRSRSSQRGVAAAAAAATQALKKSGAGVGSGVGGGLAAADKTSSGQRAAAVACRQVKESSDKQCGVCEICKIEYDTLTIHLKTKDHEYFAKNSQNFIALDTLIQATADVNKFLDEDGKKLEHLEELAVVDEQMVDDANERDPLAHHSPRTAATATTATSKSAAKRRSSNKTPSPVLLREKSKRITKGKHSSEKFQNTPKQLGKTTPKASPKSASPQKKGQPPPSLDLQGLEAVAVSTPPTTRKRLSLSASAISPPIRAMLPPSSLYKVVETRDEVGGGGGVGSPVRKTRGDLVGDSQAVASPSLIVKFKKVRATELLRLSGEAENFMFPKQRTSSDLPTDVDRQTSSEQAHGVVSSASLDSTSDAVAMDVDESEENATAEHHDDVSTQPHLQGAGRKAIAIASRRKGNSTTSTVGAVPNQSFPSTPIQPETQLRRWRVPAAITAAAATPTTPTTTSSRRHSAATPASLEAARASITLPEATRKSSRTATAIVTAATTSSRLLRAAVEAAKSKSRRLASENGVAVAVAPVTVSRTRRCSLPAGEAIAVAMRQTRKTTVVKLEDRMGENSQENERGEGEASKPLDSLAVVKEEIDCDDDDDDDDEDEEESEDDPDDDDDEDYVASKKSIYGKRKTKAKLTRRTTTIGTRLTASAAVATESIASCRGKRALKRHKPPDPSESEESPSKKKPQTQTQSPRGKRKLGRQKSNNSQTTAKKSPPRLFDYEKSERIQEMRYSFERLPAADLWHRVYARQDACQERFYEFFGSTQYRKLPYELGPIPFDRAVSVGDCRLCAEKADQASTSARSSSGTTHVLKIKKERDAEITAATTSVKQELEMDGDGPMTLNGATMPGSIPPAIASSSSTHYTHKHKKLHLLQRYRQEQQELMRKQQQQQQRHKKDATDERESHSHGDSQAVETMLSQKSNDSGTAIQTTTTTMTTICDSKASTPDPERDRRAGSTHSNASSSCASSSTMTSSKKTFHLHHHHRNKLLNRASLLSLELPPRKSPREHASTLALVSCIIKQRQDSQSKPNSEIDEPLPVDTPPPAVSTSIVKAEEETPTPKLTQSSSSAMATRSSAATPVEELRFTTEISENVKRMRRGQNKYDYSPPIVLNSSSPTRQRGPGRPPSKSQSPLGKRVALNSSREEPPLTVEKEKRRPKNVLGPTTATTRPLHHHRHHHHQKHRTPTKQQRTMGAVASSSYGVATGSSGKFFLPSVRKTGSKKGVLEFEMDASALKALDAAAKFTNVRKLEWEIDKFLQMSAKDCDVLDMDLPLEAEVTLAPMTTAGSAASASSPTKKSTVGKSSSASAATTKASAPIELNTPPPTDYFSSDFDLYDLVTNSSAIMGSDRSGAATGKDPPAVGENSKSKVFSLYSNHAMQNYYRKRKALKSNRTGWPKTQKKKIVSRPPQPPPPSIKQETLVSVHAVDDGQTDCQRSVMVKKDKVTAAGEEEVVEEQEGMGENAEAKAEVDVVGAVSEEATKRRGSGVITPPASDLDEDEDVKALTNDDDDDEEAGEAIEESGDHGDSQTVGDNEREDDDEEEEDEEEEEEEDEAKSIDDADAEAAADADVEDANEEAEEEEEDDDDDDDENEDLDNGKRAVNDRHVTRSTVISPPAAKLMNCLTVDTMASASIATTAGGTPAHTSTPTTKMLRGLRRTPQQHPHVLLNGSLGSCVSPSEKAGDNSDIFTVSSDGLDTDHDVSNSHKCEDDHDHNGRHHNHSGHAHNHSHSHNHSGSGSGGGGGAGDQTPKRKYDITKYAPNPNKSSCAAEAATAAVKSMAISQFLKKEVRVNCRRLRAPFRRFRYRR